MHAHCPLNGCAVGRELTTSSYDTEGCGRVAALVGMGMAISLYLTLLNSDVKITSLGTCIVALSVNSIFGLY